MYGIRLRSSSSIHIRRLCRCCTTYCFSPLLLVRANKFKCFNVLFGVSNYHYSSQGLYSTQPIDLWFSKCIFADAAYARSASLAEASLNLWWCPDQVSLRLLMVFLWGIHHIR